MKRRMRDLVGLAQANDRLCPWCRGRTSEEYAGELRKEVEELSGALAKGDYENAEEEPGDVIWDCLVLAHICQREGKFRASGSISRILKKPQALAPEGGENH